MSNHRRCIFQPMSSSIFAIYVFLEGKPNKSKTEVDKCLYVHRDLFHVARNEIYDISHVNETQIQLHSLIEHKFSKGV